MTTTATMPQRHRMTVRRSPSRSSANYRAFTCCEEAETPFTVIWNNNTTSQSRFPVLGRPAEVIERIINHVTQARSDPQTLEAADTVRTMVGLSDDVIDGIKILRQQLDYVTLKFRYLQLPVPGTPPLRNP